MIRRVYLAALMTVAAVVPPSTIRAQSNPIAALIDQYAAGDYNGAVMAYLAAPDFGALRREVERRGNPGNTASPAERHRQRVIVATFALDVGSRLLWPEEVDPLIELGCKLLGADDIVDEATRQWYRTSVAVAVRARDDGQLVTRAGPGKPMGSWVAPNKRLVNHVEHALRRFPDEPRFRLAAAELLAVTADSEPPRDVEWVPINVLDKRTPEGTRRVRAQEALALFEPLRANPDLRPEVDLRIGYLRYTLNESHAALESYRRARVSSDPFIKYLAVFLSGRALERLKQPAEAMAHYREALTIIPNAQSATNALAAALFVDGHPEEAYALVNAALRARPRPDDPWHHFGYADMRLLPGMFKELQAVFR